MAGQVLAFPATSHGTGVLWRDPCPLPTHFAALCGVALDATSLGRVARLADLGDGSRGVRLSSG